MGRVFTLVAIMALTALPLIGQAQQAPAQGQGGGRQGGPPPMPMGFFITSMPVNGANLGGLAGADKHCQTLAASAGQGSRTWRAYLSTQGPGAVNARDRIGSGPWANAKGQVVAKDLAHLHGDTVELAQLGNNLGRMTAFNEKGELVNGQGANPNQHDMLTGSTTAGRAFTDGMDHTCNNYTSNADGMGSVQVGHHDRSGGGNTSWNSAHGSRGCSQPNLVSTGGAGYLYCFAVN
jgi:hypothetical protein